jgi:putative Mn2+ efflux pump MntP
LLRVPTVPALVLIAVQAFAISQHGLVVGIRISESIREHAERFAGVALIAIGGLVLLGKFVTTPF